mmetsp:Transcript_25230/g.39052  ORF Transcript_25230/g.39052 Transcript_25230/m.39052 type:complete len:384 (-) Transcript_25230:273-1424(-)|eukprot:CAMPEP_0196816562 /NCGR_PEP_ID=MMETSP1362-20130617/56039_1 /TAXON_ID=163516 /ORGANISM="Leptocylindrus danicus, Strain CCMP1856" /LENGTH=383 /DNA_ID=CAMNT_0042193953 /DNA_START=209 /DNA_END=1360 /DNA_ORIENTATION=+
MANSDKDQQQLPGPNRKMTNDSSFEMGAGDHVYDPRDSPRLTGYIGVLIASIISFASCADVQNAGEKEKALSIMFGAVSFCVMILVVVLHYLAIGRELFVPRGSNSEGFVLIFLCLWWIPAVGYMTRVGGIAYQALNIYFFSWAGLVCAMNTFYNYLTLRGYFLQSPPKCANTNNTLSGWMALFIGSLVEFVAALDAKAQTEYDSSGEASWAISVGAVSMIVAFFITASHFVNMGAVGSIIHHTCCQFVVALLLVVWWTVGVAVLTQSGKIGSVLGLTCYASANEEDDRQSPDWRDGSNLYFSLWFSFFSACWIVIKWRDSGADGGVYDEKQRQHQRQHINMLETTQVHHSPPHYHHHHHSGHASASQSEVTSMNIRLGDEHF